MTGGTVNLPLSEVALLPPPNSQDPVLRGPADTVVCVIFLSLALISVGIRLHIRWKQGTMYADDWCIIVGLVFTIAMGVCVLLTFNIYYFDRHIWDAIANFKLLVKGKMVSTTASNL